MFIGSGTWWIWSRKVIIHNKIGGFAAPFLSQERWYLKWDPSVTLADKPKQLPKTVTRICEQLNQKHELRQETKVTDLRYSEFKGEHSYIQTPTMCFKAFWRVPKRRPDTRGWKVQERRLGWPLGGDVVSNFNTKGRLDYLAFKRIVQLSDFQDSFHEVLASKFWISVIKVLHWPVSSLKLSDFSSLVLLLPPVYSCSILCLAISGHL